MAVVFERALHQRYEWPVCLKVPWLLKRQSAIGFGAVFVQSPVWIGENVRPELRGFFLCVTNCSIVLGQFILSYSTRSSHERNKY